MSEPHPHATLYTIEAYHGLDGWKVVYTTEDGYEAVEEFTKLNRETDGTAYRLTTPVFDV